MARRFLLVGLFVVGPYHPGSMMQLAMAALTCVVFLVAQAQAMPYRSQFDNYVGIGCSFSLAVLFLACIFYKVTTLTELQSLQARMSYEQHEDFVLPAGALTFIIFLSVIGTLALSAVLFVMQIAQRTRDFNQHAALKQKQLLRYVRTDAPVQLPALNSGHYHLFLSQCVDRYRICDILQCTSYYRTLRQSPATKYSEAALSFVQRVEDRSGQLPCDQAALARDDPGRSDLPRR